MASLKFKGELCLCRGCKRYLKIDQFNKTKTNRFGIKSRCKACISVVNAKRRAYRNAYYKIRNQELRKTSLDFRLKCNLRDRLYRALVGTKQSGCVRYLGCSIAEFKQHLESKFQPGMTWKNYGKGGWHIDHIRPLASFNLSNVDELSQASHYSNLQPLWEKDNLSKGSSFKPFSDTMVGDIKHV